MEFLLFLALLALAIVALVFSIKGLRFLFHRFVLTTERRRKIWGRSRKAFLLIASALFLFLGARRLHYFHDEMIYAKDKEHLNPSYADQIDIETYLMSLQNVIDLFEGNPPNPDKREVPFPGESSLQLSHPEPQDPRFYLVVRLKNRGDQVAWGILNYFVEDEERRKVDVPFLPTHMTDFTNIVLPSERGERSEKEPYRKSTPYPHIESKWFQLYTKEDKK